MGHTNILISDEGVRGEEKPGKKTKRREGEQNKGDRKKCFKEAPEIIQAFKVILY